MENFIAKSIEKAFVSSEEEGKELYGKFFLNTNIYQKYKDRVDKILVDDGYEAVIAYPLS